MSFLMYRETILSLLNNYFKELFGPIFSISISGLFEAYFRPFVPSFSSIARSSSLKDETKFPEISAVYPLK